MASRSWHSICAFAIVTFCPVYGTASDVQAPPPVPAAFQSVYTLDQTLLNAFNITLGAPSTYPTDYSPMLLNADANVGPELINSGYWIGLMTQLQELKAMGVQGVTIEMGFPMLYPPFMKSVGAPLAAYQSFYSNVAAAVRSLGLKLVVENDIMLTGGAAGAGWNSTGYLAGLTWAQYEQARAQTAAAVAKTLHPDYMVLLEEPDTESANSGQANVLIPTDSAAMLAQEIDSIKQAGVTGIQLGAGTGVWLEGFQDFIAAYVNVPGIDFIDMHIYAINGAYLPNALTIAQLAAAAHLPVTMSECWLHKELDTELNVLTQNQIRARDPFSFWEPLDLEFLKVVNKLADFTQMRFVTPFQSKLFFGSVTYDSKTAALAPTDILNMETQVSTMANQSGSFTSTGTGFYDLLVNPPNRQRPTVPGGLIAHPNVSTILWNASSDKVGVAGYHVLRDGSPAGDTSSTSFQDSGLKAGATYTYTVEAFDLGGNVSGQSQSVSLTTPNSTPTAPTNLVGVALSSGKIKLTWDASTGTGVANYIVLWGTNSKPSGLTQAGASATTSFTDFPLSSGTTYYFAVQGVATTGATSPLSAVIAVRTPPLPSAPASLAAKPGSSTQIDLTWGASKGTFPITRYYILRGAAATGMAQIATVRAPATAYTDRSVSPATQYYYAIEAVDTAGDMSALSSKISVSSYALPSAPASVTAVPNSASKVTLTWPAAIAPPGLSIVRYLVYRGESATTLNQVAIRNGTTYTDLTASPATTYYYAVMAVDTAGDKSDMSAVVSAKTFSMPAAPKGLTATATGTTQVDLSWSASIVAQTGLPIDHYVIFAGTSPTSLAQVAIRSGMSYTASGLTAGTTYYYQVQAVDQGGDLSPKSASVHTVTP